MNHTILKRSRTIENQRNAFFTGEGAYHGSASKEVSDVLLNPEKKTFPDFRAEFPNVCNIKKQLRVPSQIEIQNDQVTFIWCPFDEAVQAAGPLTQSILLDMASFLKRDRKYVYIDSKIQYFHKGDSAVDSNLWHVDGSIGIRNKWAFDCGYKLLHDVNYTINDNNRYLAYQSSHHCATEFAVGHLSLDIPQYIPSFDVMNRLVEEIGPRYISQPAGSIVYFDNGSLHRAIPAKDNGWRLWIRCMETNREINPTRGMIECYGTVFKAP